MNLATSLWPKNLAYALSAFPLVSVHPYGVSSGETPNIGLHSCLSAAMSRCMESSSMKPQATARALSCISQYGNAFPSWQQVPALICFLLSCLLPLSIQWAFQLKNPCVWERSSMVLPQLRLAYKPMTQSLL